jgi:hypothetical protein
MKTMFENKIEKSRAKVIRRLFSGFFFRPIP